MPSFTIEAAYLANEGPVVDVTLSLQGGAQAALAALAQGGAPAAAPGRRGLVTRGHGGVTFDGEGDGLLAPLGLHPVGTIGVNTPTDQGVACGLYAVRLTLPYGGYLDTTVIQSPPTGFGGQNIDGVIGRDVLAWGILIYMGQRGQFTLSF